MVGIHRHVRSDRYADNQASRSSAYFSAFASGLFGSRSARPHWSRHQAKNRSATGTPHSRRYVSFAPPLSLRVRIVFSCPYSAPISASAVPAASGSPSRACS